MTAPQDDLARLLPPRSDAGLDSEVAQRLVVAYSQATRHRAGMRHGDPLVMPLLVVD